VDALGVTYDTDGPVRLEATVEGHVQGVGFRYHVRREAHRLPLTGWVANQADGSVRCVAEGPREALETLLAVLQAGPPGAHVRAVRTTWRAATGSFGDFRIRSGAHPGD
jgi:acylphosphatase